MGLPALLAVASTAETVRNGFVYDDAGKIEVLAHSSQSLSDFFHFRRMLTQASLMLDYAMWGRWAPGFHFTNVLLHAASSALAAWVAQALTGSRRVALLCGIFFAVHPVHVEAVSSLTNRKDVLATIFILLAMWFWSQQQRPVLNGSLSALFFVFGILSKEVAAAGLPVMLFLAALFFGPERSSMLRLRRAALGSLPFFAGGVLLASVWIRAPLELFRSPAIATITEQQLDSYGQVLANCAAAVVEMVRLLVFPLRMSVDYPIEPRLTIVSPIALLGACLCLIWCSVAVALRRRFPVAAFGLLWVVVMVLPCSNLIPLTTFFVADRYLYAPSLGFCLAVAVLVDFGLARVDVLHRDKTRAVLRATVAIVIAALTVRSALRCTDWRDNETLWRSALRDGFGTMRVHANLGHVLLRDGRYDQAIEQYRRAVAIAPRTAWPRRSLAATLHAVGRGDEALAQCNELLRISPNDEGGNYVMGRVLRDRGDAAAAITRFAVVLRLNPTHSGALDGAAKILLERAEGNLGDVEAAVNLATRAVRSTEWDRDLNIEARRTLIRALAASGQWDRARAECRDLLKQAPGDAVCARVFP